MTRTIPEKKQPKETTILQDLKKYNTLLAQFNAMKRILHVLKFQIVRKADKTEYITDENRFTIEHNPKENPKINIRPIRLSEREG